MIWAACRRIDRPGINVSDPILGGIARLAVSTYLAGHGYCQNEEDDKVADGLKVRLKHRHCTASSLPLLILA
jgi:hypothetical protein